MLNVFKPRRVISNRRGIVDGTLEGEDPMIEKLNNDLKKLRHQVYQLTVGKAELEKEYMNTLSSIEEEKNVEFSLIKEHIRETEQSHSFMKVAKNSMAEKVVNLEEKLIEKQKLLDEQKLKTQEVKESRSSLQLSCDSLIKLKDDELNTCKEKTIKFEKELQRATEIISVKETERVKDEKKIAFLKYQLEVKSLECTNLNKKLEEKVTEVEGLTKEQKLLMSNLLGQFEDKEQIIEKMSQTANYSFSQRTASKQKYLEEINELKVGLQQKNTDVESVSIDWKKDASILRQKEAEIFRVTQNHQRKLEELDEIRKRYETELEENINQSTKFEEDTVPFENESNAHQECRLKRGYKIARKLTSVNVAKSRIEGNLNELLNNIARIEGSINEEKNESVEESECTISNGQLGENDGDVKQMQKKKTSQTTNVSLINNDPINTFGKEVKCSDEETSVESEEYIVQKINELKGGIVEQTNKSEGGIAEEARTILKRYIGETGENLKCKQDETAHTADLSRTLNHILS